MILLKYINKCVPKKRELILCSPEHLNRMCFVRKPSIVRYIGSIFHLVGEDTFATYDRKKPYC